MTAIRRPRLLVFDVNETLSDLSPLAARFADLGLPEHLATVWFTAVLRDGFALTAAGTTAPFADIAAEALRGLFAEASPSRDPDEAVEHVLEGLAGLGVHRDVPAGVRALADLDLRLVTLSNGSTDIARGLLTRAGLVDHFESLLSVEDAGAWKPAGRAYAHALERTGVAPEDAMLVAVHPWDTDGANRAGLSSAWINRTGTRYPGYFTQPTVEADSLVALAQQLS